MKAHEVNKFIHCKIMNKCWHLSSVGWRCMYCNVYVGDSYCNPDYSNDFNAIARVEAKLIKIMGFTNAICNLKYQLEKIIIKKYGEDLSSVRAMFTTARERADAIINTYKQYDKIRNQRSDQRN